MSNSVVIWSISFIILAIFTETIVCQSFDKSRCRCICPDPDWSDELKNVTHENRRVYTKNVKAKECICEKVVLSFLKDVPEDLGNKFCLRCICAYQQRDTTMVQVVVILVICVLSLLVVYMGFLLCLDPMMKQPRRDHPYERHQTDDEDNIFAAPNSINDSASPSSSMEYAETRQRRPSEGVLGRVEAQQNKWFQKVHEQRRKIFTDHSMLN